MLTSGQNSKSDAEVWFYGKVRRSCDACRLRKTRCNGSQPCNRCSKSLSECTFHDVPRKKCPRRSRRAEASPITLSIPDKDQQSEHQSPQQRSNDLLYTQSTHIPEYASVLRDEYDLVATFFDPSEGLPGIDDNMSSSPDLPELVPTDCSATMMTSGGSRELGEEPYANSQKRISSTSLPPQAFLPLMEVFFEQLFPIMPVLDRKYYVDSDLLRVSSPLCSSDYCMLAAASALTAVQLSLPASFVQKGLPSLSAELLVDECLRVRRQTDYIEDPDISTVLASFFLFGYYGNLERHSKARHYLHEAISFAESIGLDDEDSLSRLPPKQGQRHRIVFWLLFVTERAYALQQDNRVKIHTTLVKLPSIFESDDPRLLYGFVSLVNVFLTIDQTFLSAWAGKPQKDVLSKTWVTEVLRRLGALDITHAESLERHRLDVSISRHWLEVLLWKISAKQGYLTLGSAEEFHNLQFPIRLAREVVMTTSRASQAALDSHGIGMEQKLADISGCLADALRCAQGDVSELFAQGREYLMALLLRLSQIRGAPSPYIQPLLAKLDVTTCQMISPLASITPRTLIEDGNRSELAAVESQDDQNYRAWLQSVK